MRGLQSLRVYQAAQLYAADVNKALLNKRLPLDDATQIRKSSKSIGDNIAEGHGHGDGKNRVRYFRIARGSAQESLNQLKNFRTEGYLTRCEFSSLFNRGRTIVKMLAKLTGD